MLLHLLRSFQKMDAILEQKRREEEKRNQEEIEKFQKKFQGKRKYRNRKQMEAGDDLRFWNKHKVLVLFGIGLICSFLGYIIIMNSI